MEETGRVEGVGGGGGGSDGSAAVGTSLVPEAPAFPNSPTASAGKATRSRRNSAHSTVSSRSSESSVGAQTSDAKDTLRGSDSQPFGSAEFQYPASPITDSFENKEQADIAYQADCSSSSSGEVDSDEEEEDFAEKTPKNKMSAVTSSTMDIDQFSSDPFVDFATQLNDTPIPLDLRSDPRPKSPNLESGSSSLSSVPSTPTNRRRHALPKQKFAALQEAAREVRSIAAEIKEARAEYKHTRGLFEHRNEDENATIEILDAAVDATNRRLVRAVEDDEKIQSGNPPRHVPYPPETIPELLEAVEKAEADRENWYAETRRLFWIFEEIDRERLPALKRRMDSAREKEAAARMKAGQAATAAGCERPITGTESASDFSPPTVRRVRPDETPVASPATSDTSDQDTIVRSIRNAMRPATDVAGAPETPTKKSRR